MLIPCEQRRHSAAKTIHCCQPGNCNRQARTLCRGSHHWPAAAPYTTIMTMYAQGWTGVGAVRARQARWFTYCCGDTVTETGKREREASDSKISRPEMQATAGSSQPLCHGHPYLNSTVRLSHCYCHCPSLLQRWPGCHLALGLFSQGTLCPPDANCSSLLLACLLGSVAQCSCCLLG